MLFGGITVEAGICAVLLVASGLCLVLAFYLSLRNNELKEDLANEQVINLCLRDNLESCDNYVEAGYRYKAKLHDYQI